MGHQAFLVNLARLVTPGTLDVVERRANVVNREIQALE